MFQFQYSKANKNNPVSGGRVRTILVEKMSEHFHSILIETLNPGKFIARPFYCSR